MARESVQNASLTWNSDWEQSGAIRPKAGLCRHCGSHSSVASLIAPEQWCMFW